MAAAQKSPDIRWRQRFGSFQQALVHLKNATQLAGQRPLSELERQGLIKAFEFTHELAWNTLKDYLEDQGETRLHGSKDVIRKAFQVGLVEDGEVWMDMIESRNRSVHLYNERMATAISEQIITGYVPAFERFERVFLSLGESA